MKNNLKNDIIKNIFKNKYDLELNTQSFFISLKNKKENLENLNNKYLNNQKEKEESIKKYIEDKDIDNLKNETLNLISSKEEVIKEIDESNISTKKDIETSLCKEVISSYLIKKHSKLFNIDKYLSYLITILFSLVVVLPMLINKSIFVVILGAILFSIIFILTMYLIVYKKKYLIISRNIFYKKYLFLTEANFVSFKNAYKLNIFLDKKTENKLILEFYFSQYNPDDLINIYSFLKNKENDENINSTIDTINTILKKDDYLEKLVKTLISLDNTLNENILDKTYIKEKETKTQNNKNIKIIKK